jgi:hypothetical protein
VKRNYQRDAITAELNRHGVAWREEHGGKHGRIVLMIRGKPFIPYRRGGNQWDGPVTRVVRSQVRRVLRDHGSLAHG